MRFTSILSAIVLAAPALAQTSCFGIDGLLYAPDPTEPCALESLIFVDDSSVQTCGGQGTTSVLGPWAGNCLAEYSVTVSERVTTATYTNSTGSYTLLLTLENPSIFDECHVAGQVASSNFVSTPNCL